MTEPNHFSELLKKPTGPTDEELEEFCPDTKVHYWTISNNNEQEQFEDWEADYLNQIYPQKLNKKTVSPGVEFIFHFLGSSLHYWVEMVEKQPPFPEKLSRKDINYIRDELKDPDDQMTSRWAPYFENKQEYNKALKSGLEAKFTPPGKTVRTYSRGEETFEIAVVHGDDTDFIEYKKRFEILLLLFIDGASFVEDDHQWKYYMLYKLNKHKQRQFAGLLSMYSFNITYAKQRDRISQVLILPSFQGQGHAKFLVDKFYSDSLADANCFEITVEGPSFQFQCLRDYKEAEMLIKQGFFMDTLNSKVIKSAQDIKDVRAELLKLQTVREIKKKLKLPGHQIQRVANILIYSRILGSGDDMMLATFEEAMRKKTIEDRSAFKSRKQRPSLQIEDEELDLKMFMLLKSKEQYILNSNSQIQRILRENIEGYRRVINKLKKEKLI